MNTHVYSPASLVENDARAWLKILAKYRQPRIGRSALELLVTVVPFAGFWAIAYFALAYGFWYGLIAIIPAAAFL
ncbi:MAG TPA: fatty acid desaturase, partial [Candidatus Binatia bacterium]|nr:fatty acid desaturase [Candidatus Binatia bacterium]